MNWKNRLKNYNFWISIFSAVLLILQALKIKFDVAYVNEIFTAVLGLLVVIGIISDPTKTTVKTQDATWNKSKVQDVREKNQEEEKNEQVKTANLPIDSKNETNNVNIQNDLQTIVTAFKSELDKTIGELSTIKETIKNSVVENITSITGTVNEPSPAAVEKGEITNNPYVDVIN